MDLLASVLSKYDSLTAANFPSSSRPPIFHDLAPQVVSGQLHPPYVVVNIGKGPVDLTFESAMTEENTLNFVVYYDDEGSLNTTIRAIRFNGQVLSNNAGFDNGTLPSLTEGTLLAMLLTSPPATFWDNVNYQNKYIYRGEFSYDIMVQLS
jgi:hypothetical protein